MFPARVEAHSNRCANCKHHIPNFRLSNGFGMCYGSLRNNLVYTVGAPSLELATHESFSCTLFDIKINRK